MVPGFGAGLMLGRGAVTTGFIGGGLLMGVFTTGFGFSAGAVVTANAAPERDISAVKPSAADKNLFILGFSRVFLMMVRFSLRKQDTSQRWSTSKRVSELPHDGDFTKWLGLRPCRRQRGQPREGVEGEREELEVEALVQSASHRRRLNRS
jgi:hypothetical protein